MKAVIMSAGKSTRTYPLTLTRPKALLPIGNVPLVERQLQSLEGIVDEVVLVVGYRHEMLRERLGSHFGDIAITYVMQEEQRGTGHAVLQCEKVLREPFLAMNGDDLWDPRDLKAVSDQQQAALVKEVPDPRLYAICKIDAEDNLLRIVEKPVDIFSNLANIGVYKFTTEVFDILAHTEPSVRGEIEITAAIQTLSQETKFKVVRSQGYWLAVGYPWHLLDANAYWLDHYLPKRMDGEVSPLAAFNGPVSVGKGSVIKPGVYAEGPVLIGEDCEIGPNCFLRAGTSIGNGCKVGQGCEIKNSILMDHAKVPHLSYVGDSIIGENSNLGCGTVIANFRHDGKSHRSMYGGQLIDTGRRKLGAIIGDDVHTGINTSIYPGRKMWPHTHTLPGEVVKQDKVQ